MDKRTFSILVADDDDIAREVVRSILAADGYVVATAADGTDAILKLNENPFDMVITDLRMPGAGGMEVLKHAIGQKATACVVILTAYGSIDTTLEALRQGAYDYLAKPFKGQEIRYLAERAFQRHTLIRQNEALRGLLRECLLEGAGEGDLRDGDRTGRGLDAAMLDGRIESLGVLTAEEVRSVSSRMERSAGKAQLS